MRGGAPRGTSPQAPVRLMWVSHWSDRSLENLTIDQRMPAQEAPHQDRRTLSLGCSRVGTPPRSSVLTCSIISEENRRSPSMHAPAYGSQHKDAHRSRCFTALAYIAFRISASTSCDRKNLKKMDAHRAHRSPAVHPIASESVRHPTSRSFPAPSTMLVFVRLSCPSAARWEPGSPHAARRRD
jgi:hypothetical protein